MDPAAIIARAKMQAAQILRDAEQKAKALSVSKKIAKKPSDQFKTPDRPTSSVVSPVSESSSKQPKQYGLVNFFGTAKQKEEASPILAEKEIKASPRVQQSKAMKDLMKAKEEYDKFLEAQQLENAVDETDDYIRKKQSRGGRKKESDIGSTLTRHSNRTKEGAKRRRIEFGAYEKMKVCDDIEQQRQSFSREDELWAHMRKVYGVTVQRLKDIYAKREQWIKLVKINNLGANRGGKKGKKRKGKNAKIRSAGGGRKREYQEQISKLKGWLQQERSFGHNISKRELLAEFCCYLVQHAKDLLSQADQMAAPDSPLMQAKVKLMRKEADAAMIRKKKLMDGSTSYGRNYADKLIEWIGASYMQKELSHKLSAIESKARAQLTYQGIDRIIWLMGAADEAALEESGLVSNPAEVIEARKNLCITMSDQVPIWGKAVSQKIIFAEHELAGCRYQDAKNFSEIRDEIAAVQEKVRNNAVQIITASGDAGLKKVAGMKTMSANSYDEKYRLTYEARQKIYNIVGEGPLTGEVAKGLLVFGGQHARLSNVDEHCKWVETEEFLIGDNQVKHEAGQVCKVMKPFVKLRNEFPGLFEKISIMTQPASNCDGVLMKWIAMEQAMQEPAGIAIKDSFAANFAAETAQAEHICNIASAHILGHMTAQLQVTDTDFARAFKHKFKHELDDLRRDYKKEKGTEKGFSIGHEQIIKAAVSSQDYMEALNEKNNWVVEAAIRHGLVAYRCSPSGELKKITDEEWACKMGTKRIPSDWLEPRYSWLQDGVPSMPDFSLSRDASCITDLISWSNDHPVQAGEEEEHQVPAGDEKEHAEKEHESKHEMEAAKEKSEVDFTDISDELLLPCNNSLFFSLSPSLRRDFYRRNLLDETFGSLVLKNAKAREDMKKRSLVRSAARRWLSKKLLSSMSKEEALGQIKARSSNKKRIGKRLLKKSIKEKPSAKTKASLKNKPSAKAKLVKKNSMKKVGDGVGKKLLASMKKDMQLTEHAGEEKPPLPPPSEHPLMGLEVRITDEQAGPKSFGKTGTLSSINEHKATVFTASGTISCDRNYIEEERAEWKKPVQHKQFNSLSRAVMQKILDAMACFPQAFVEYSLQLQPIGADGYLEDEHLVATWEWMRYSLKIPDEVQMLDPALVARLSTTLLSEDEETFQHLQASILSFASGVEMLLCPIQGHSPAHWTLLVKDSSGWRYYETLSSLHKECHQRAVALISLFDSVEKDQVQLQRCNHIKQKNADCGFFVIAYMEQEACRSTSGPASRGWPDQLQSDWKIKVQKLQKALQAEFDKLMKAKHEAEKQAASLKKSRKMHIPKHQRD